MNVARIIAGAVAALREAAEIMAPTPPPEPLTPARRRALARHYL